MKAPKKPAPRHREPTPAEEISGGLRDAGDAIAAVLDKLGGEAFGNEGKQSLTDGLFAIARALDRIAEAMEKNTSIPPSPERPVTTTCTKPDSRRRR